MRARRLRYQVLVRAIVAGVVVVVAGCAGAPRPVSEPVPVDGARAWQLLAHELPGRWTLQRAPADAGKPPFEVSYHLISNASALVEDWGVGGAHETETIFYRDHARTLLTHYCAQGNQPRLVATAIDGASGAVTFQFLDVTNREPDQDMLIERQLRVADGQLEIVETYRTSDGRDDRTTYRFAPGGVAVDGRSGSLAAAYASSIFRCLEEST